MRRLTALLGCVLAAVVSAPAANATEWKPSPSLTSVTVTGVFSGVFLNGLQITASCEAVAAGAVAATVIEECYITSNGVQHPSVAPLNATASAFVEQVDTLQFQLCFRAYAIPMLDPTRPAVASGCTGGGLPIGGLPAGSGFATATN